MMQHQSGEKGKNIVSEKEYYLFQYNEINNIKWDLQKIKERISTLRNMEESKGLGEGLVSQEFLSKSKEHRHELEQLVESIDSSLNEFIEETKTKLSKQKQE